MFCPHYKVQVNQTNQYITRKCLTVRHNSNRHNKKHVLPDCTVFKNHHTPGDTVLYIPSPGKQSTFVQCQIHISQIHVFMYTFKHACVIFHTCIIKTCFSFQYCVHADASIFVYIKYCIITCVDYTLYTKHYVSLALLATTIVPSYQTLYTR